MSAVVERSGTIRQGPKTVIGWFGEFHPKALEALDVEGPLAGFELILDAIPLPRVKATKTKPPLELSDLQPVKRDFAFVLDRGIQAAKVIRAAESADKKLVTGVAVFDLFESDALGPGRKSLAIQVTLQPRDKTLTDEEAGRLLDARIGTATVDLPHLTPAPSPDDKGHHQERGVSGPSAFANRVADALREVCAADLAIWFSGFAHRGLKAGPITRRDLYQALPGATHISAAEVSGAQISRTRRSAPGRVRTSPASSSGRRFRVRVVRSRTSLSASWFTVARSMLRSATRTLNCDTRRPVGRRNSS